MPMRHQQDKDETGTNMRMITVFPILDWILVPQYTCSQTLDIDHGINTHGHGDVILITDG